ncbi:hypothetical protein QVD17_03001 [Tagetes erecta]|uniref:Uncharacterized protein n=1 Tax=Tagetes erecta TaxID=13708 RepID=A0AAD8LCN5_TARER|nr:hypothetical protein QVD17_03001 [Tagetes erecta]
MDYVVTMVVTTYEYNPVDDDDIHEGQTMAWRLGGWMKTVSEVKAGTCFTFKPLFFSFSHTHVHHHHHLLCKLNE